MKEAVIKRNIFIRKAFYFLNFLLLSLILLELLMPGFATFYININFLIVLCLLVSVLDLKVNN